MDYFRQIEKHKLSPPQTFREVGTIGLALGALAGLAFGLAVHQVNARYLLGVPYVEYPLGLWGNLILLVFAGGIAGWLCTHTQETVPGVAQGALIIAFVFELYVFLTPYVSFSERVKLALWALGPMLFFVSLMAVFLGILRWAAYRPIERSDLPAWHPARILPLLSVLGLAACVGISAFFPGSQIRALNATQALLQSGLAASDPADLPAALRSNPLQMTQMADFQSFAQPDYTLEILQNLPLQTTLHAWPDSPNSEVVMARFVNGWVVICKYDPLMDQVLACQSYTQDQVPPPAPTLK